MIITVIGWYGTETIGDRAILAGLISFFNKAYNDFEIKLGSLHPFFSERTLNEDFSFYKKIIKKELKIELFNSQNSKELVKAIQDSDLVVMGGGPLMDLNELFMVEYAFKKAKKLGKKTALLGIGVGPLFQKKYRKSVLNISLHSDVIILRDSKSKDNLEEIFTEFNKEFKNEQVTTSYDPAVECALLFLEYSSPKELDYIAVNLRKFPLAYNQSYDVKDINERLKNFILDLALENKERDIRLIPMHYFHVGEDDRSFLNAIALELNQDNIYVQNEVLTLEETMNMYQNAYFNVGMRFHSVVLQTIVNGKNYVLDYTEPKRGKISGFLQDIDTKDFYLKRYMALQIEKIPSNLMRNKELKFNFSRESIDKRLDIYMAKLKELR